MAKAKGKKPTKGKGKKTPPPPPSPSSSPPVSSDDEQPPAAENGGSNEPGRNSEPDNEGFSQGGPKDEGPHKVRPKKSCRLKDEQQEADVLEWVEENAILWNSKHKEFKMKNKKDRLWEEKADELGYDGKLL